MDHKHICFFFVFLFCPCICHAVWWHNQMVRELASSHLSKTKIKLGSWDLAPFFKHPSPLTSVDCLHFFLFSKLQGLETQDSPRGGCSKGFAAKSWRAELAPPMPPGLCQLELDELTTAWLSSAWEMNMGLSFLLVNVGLWNFPDKLCNLESDSFLLGLIVWQNFWSFYRRDLRESSFVLVWGTWESVSTKNGQKLATHGYHKSWWFIMDCGHFPPLKLCEDLHRHNMTRPCGIMWWRFQRETSRGQLKNWELTIQIQDSRVSIQYQH